VQNLVSGVPRIYCLLVRECETVCVARGFGLFSGFWSVKGWFRVCEDFRHVSRPGCVECSGIVLLQFQPFLS